MRREAGAGFDRRHEPVDDDSVLLLAARDDPEAFTEFYRRNRDDLLEWAFRQTFDAEAAADVVAETFAALLERSHRFDPRRGPARAWLWGFASTEVRRWQRRGAAATKARRKLGIAVVSFDDDALAYVESLVDAEAVSRELRAHLDRLSTKERAALELRVIEHLPYEEIAARLGCQPGAARVRVNRALGHLRESMQMPGWSA